MKNELFVRAQSISVQVRRGAAQHESNMTGGAGRPEFTLLLRMLLGTISPTDCR